MDQARSERLWLADQLGIAGLIAASFVPGLFWGFRCRLAVLRAYTSIVGVATVLNLWLVTGKVGTLRRNTFPACGAATVRTANCQMNQNEKAVLQRQTN